MHLNFIQYITFFFMVGWILGDVGGFEHSQKLYLALLGASIAFYLSNGHYKMWQSLKRYCKS